MCVDYVHGLCLKVITSLSINLYIHSEGPSMNCIESSKYLLFGQLKNLSPLLDFLCRTLKKIHTRDFHSGKKFQTQWLTVCYGLCHQDCICVYVCILRLYTPNWYSLILAYMNESVYDSHNNLSYICILIILAYTLEMMYAFCISENKILHKNI